MYSVRRRRRRRGIGKEVFKTDSRVCAVPPRVVRVGTTPTLAYILSLPNSYKK